jgi:hypothetical protein
VELGAEDLGVTLGIDDASFRCSRLRQQTWV